MNISFDFTLSHIVLHRTAHCSVPLYGVILPGGLPFAVLQGACAVMNGTADGRLSRTGIVLRCASLPPSLPTPPSHSSGGTKRR